MTSKLNKDLAGEMRVQKVGPYTITTIGGPEEYRLWKEKQWTKEEAWRAAASARHAIKRSQALSILEGNAALSKDHGAEVQKRFKESQERQAALYAKAIAQQSLVTSNKKSSMISIIKQKLIDFFSTKI